MLALVRDPSGSEEAEADGEEVVVEETNIDRKDAHHQQNIAGIVEVRNGVFQIVGLPNCIDADGQEHGAMTDVPVHNPEQEGKGHDREERRVGLTIVRQAIGVNQILENLSEFVLADVGGRALLGLRAMRDEHRGVRACLRAAEADEQGADLLFLALRVPAVRAEVHVALEEVQSRIERLLLFAEQAPLLNDRVASQPGRLQESEGLAVHKVIVRPQEPLLVLHLNLQRCQRLLCNLAVGWPPVTVDAIGGADLLDLLAHGGDLLAQAVVLEVNHEDRLLDFAACFRVLDRLKDLLEVREGIATRGAEERAREAVLVCLGNHSGDVAEHGLQGTTAASLLVVQQGASRGEIEFIVISFGPDSPRCRHVGHGRDGRLDHIALFERRIALRSELGVVLLELDELLVDLLQSTLNLVKLEFLRVIQEAVHVVLDDFSIRDSGQLLKQEANDALHLVDALDVLLVWSRELARVHVLELHLRLVPDNVDKVTSPVDGQDKCAVLHWL
mmetsp:Transcript_79796/g.258536  ORF Transcript_79796/g.258536 Transcript_79796/m.258536 type:complete len:502 (-) Transcript_79796:161-1666(-)